MSDSLGDGISIRRAANEDLRGCTAIDASIGGRRLGRNFFEERLAQDSLYVAEADERVVGYITFGRRYWTWLWFVDMVRVHPDYRRRGIARALYTEVEGACESPFLLSSTMDSNEPSIGMHRALGFQEHGYVRNPTGGKEIVFLKQPSHRPVE